MVTLSGLSLVASCPGSASLPKAKWVSPAASLGSAIHALVEDTIDGSRYRGEPYDIAALAAMFRLDEGDARRLAFLAEHVRLPIPTGALTEKSLAYFADGTVREAHGGHGDYLDEGQWLSGQLDVFWREGATLWLCEIKTGDEAHVTPIDRNWQLRAGAVLAARWTGAQRVIPAICYINAAECSAAVREGRAYEGRWEVGAPRDAAALDAVEAELRAVLARAKGDARNDEGQVRAGDVGATEGRDLPAVDREAAAQADGPARREAVARGLRGGRDAHDGDVRGALILGPHCAFCPARAACPAFAAEAMTLARTAGWNDGGQDATTRNDAEPQGLRGGGAQPITEAGALPTGATTDGVAGVPDEGAPLVQVAAPSMASGTRSAVLTPALAARSLGLVAALRRWCDAIEATARAVALDNGGALLLADGREYRPIVTAERHYLTRPTYEALVEVVGEEQADEAFAATAASLKRAMVGAPAGSWKRLKDGLEARGAVVVSAGEEWRRVWPAKPVEGGSDGERGQGEPDLAGVGPGLGAGLRDGEQAREDERDRARGGGHRAGQARLPSDARGGARSVALPDPGTVGPGRRGGAAAASGELTAARAPCSVCGTIRAVNRKSGLVRAHPEQDTADYCKGSGKPPAAPP